MKRMREDDIEPHFVPAHAYLQQRVVPGVNGARPTILHSPYGASGRVSHGWGSLFSVPHRVEVPGFPRLRIGVSSLNAVPSSAGGDRSMRTLLSQYRLKFNALEHCYLYHKVAEAAAWASWGDMVRHGGGSSNNSGSRVKGMCANQLVFGGDKEEVQQQQKHEEYNHKNYGSSGGDIQDSAIPSNAIYNVDPQRFIFTVKANNYLTHVKQLAISDAVMESHICTYFGECCAALEPFIGPVLLQLPPSFHRSSLHLARLAELDARLPKDTVTYREEVNASNGQCKCLHCSSAAAADTSAPSSSSSSSSERWARNGRYMELTRRRVRVAVEFRHRSWFHPDTFTLLRSLGWALVVAHDVTDVATTFATPVDTGVEFMYLRLHGSLGSHVGDYGPNGIAVWTDRIMNFLCRGESRGGDSDDVGHAVPCRNREVYCFFNNGDSHVKGLQSSIVDACYLSETLQDLLSKYDRQQEDGATDGVNEAALTDAQTSECSLPASATIDDAAHHIATPFFTIVHSAESSRGECVTNVESTGSDVEAIEK